MVFRAPTVRAEAKLVF